MKNLVALAAIICVAITCYAQSPHFAVPYSSHVKTMNSIPTVPGSGHSNVYHRDRNIFNMDLDYNLADQNLRGITPGGIVIPLNSRYTCSDTFSFSYVGVSFDTLIDANTLVHSFYPATTVTIDTIDVVVGHENNSGSMDTIVINIVQLYGNDTLLTDNIIYSDTIYTDTALSAGNNWLNGATIFTSPGITLSQGEKFGVKIKYYGSDLDSFAVVGNSYDDCSGACASERSLFYPSSFYYFNYLGSGVNLCEEWPNFSPVGDVFLDCDADGSYTPNACEAFYTQNFDIIAKVTVDAVLAVVTSSPGTPICQGQSLPIEAQGIGGTGTYTYSWLPSTGLSNPSIQNPDASPTITTTYTVVVDDGDTTAQGTITVTVTNCVWPGDADDDGTADNNDLFAIGLTYGMTGAARADQTTTWDGKLPSADWNDTLPNGVNDKYSDANGNGAVTLDDTLAVALNYGSFHLKTGQVNNGNPPLSLVFSTDTFNAGDVVDAMVMLGDNNNQVSNAYGIAFSIDYDASVVDTSSVRFAAATGWMGTPGTNMFGFGKDLGSQSKIDAAVVRINQTNTSGFGQIGTLHFKIRTDVGANQLLQLSTSGIKMIDNGMNSIDIDGSNTSVQVIGTGIISPLPDASSFTLYPIPATDQLFVSSQSADISSITIHDVLGREVLQLDNLGEKKLPVSLKNFSPGVYLMKIQTEKGEVEKKFIVE